MNLEKLKKKVLYTLLIQEIISLNQLFQIKIKMILKIIKNDKLNFKLLFCTKFLCIKKKITVSK